MKGKTGNLSGGLMCVINGFEMINITAIPYLHYIGVDRKKEMSYYRARFAYDMVMFGDLKRILVDNITLGANLSKRH